MVIGEKNARCEVWRGDTVFSQEHFGFGIGHRSIENTPEEAK